MADLTILSMNCLGLPLPVPGLSHRLRALGNTLAASDAEVACLQEVGRWRHLHLLRHDYATWPSVVTMNHPYAPKGGLATLARLPVERTSYTPFRERGSPLGLQTPERLQHKGVLQTDFAIEGRPVVVFNTHLAANYNARWTYSNPYAKVERAQLRELAAAVGAVPDDTIVIVAGDFNVPRGSWLYHEFVHTTGLHDPLGSSTEPTFRPPTGMPARAAQALDHILVRLPGGLTMRMDAELCFGEPVMLPHGARGYLSDHLGVRLSLHWRTSRRHARAVPEAPAAPVVDGPVAISQEPAT